MKRDGQIIADLTEDGMQAVIAKGGDGGFGNAHFKSSVRQTPVIAEVGEPGDAFEAEIELKLLADVGLVGLPNAGKSTFLASVTNAKPEIADYAFTTLTPNLGVATIDRNDLLIADIPGLIEGASDGRGLGHDFLRHVDRTAVLLHLIDVYQDDAGQAYRTIRHELEKYSDLKDRFEVVALTKCEGLDDEIIEMQKQAILEVNPEAKIFAISSVAKKNLDDLLRALLAAVKENQKQQEIAAEQIGSTPIEFKTAIISHDMENLPTISLSHHELKKAWQVTQDEKGVYHVTGEKIEKFARRTDLSNYASVNRLRDIMKKLGIRAELTTRGAKADSIIEISGKHFTLVEDY